MPRSRRRYRADGNVRLAVHRKQAGAQAAALQTLSADQYFGVVGDTAAALPPACRRLRSMRKKVTAQVHMASGFPLQLEQLAPALTILAIKDQCVAHTALHSFPIRFPNAAS
jgi:hypothetical protein